MPADGGADSASATTSEKKEEESKTPTEADAHIAETVGQFAANFALDYAIDKSSVAAKNLAVKFTEKMTAKVVSRLTNVLPEVTDLAGSWAMKATIVHVAERAVVQSVSAALSAATTLLNVGLVGLNVAGAIYDRIDPRHFGQMPIYRDHLLAINDSLVLQHARKLADITGGLEKNTYPVEVGPETYFAVEALSSARPRKFNQYCMEYLRALRVNSRGESLRPPTDPVEPKDRVSEAFLVPMKRHVVAALTNSVEYAENHRYRAAYNAMVTVVPELAVWGLATMLLADFVTDPRDRVAAAVTIRDGVPYRSPDPRISFLAAPR